MASQVMEAREFPVAYELYFHQLPAVCRYSVMVPIIGMIPSLAIAIYAVSLAVAKVAQGIFKLSLGKDQMIQESTSLNFYGSVEGRKESTILFEEAKGYSKSFLGYGFNLVLLGLPLAILNCIECLDD